MATRLLLPQKSVLLIVDIQEKFLPILYEAERVVRNARILVQVARKLDIPIVVTEQYPKGLGPTIGPLLEVLSPDQAVMEKISFGSLGDLSTKVHLATLDRSQVIVCGLEAHICVNQTVHQLLAEGYDAHLVQDAISSRTQANYEIGLAKMIQSGAIPSSVEMVLFELMQTASHPFFKELQSLVK